HSADITRRAESLPQHAVKPFETQQPVYRDVGKEPRCRGRIPIMHVVTRLVLITIAALVLAGCASAPPKRQDNLCEIFEQEPGWYDHAYNSERRWGIPIPIQMAIVQRESSFRALVRPARTRLLGFIPWRRPSSAAGYAQAQDPAWQEYLEMTGRSAWFTSRTNMGDALDFIGWY